MAYIKGRISNPRTSRSPAKRTTKSATPAPKRATARRANRGKGLQIAGVSAVAVASDLAMVTLGGYGAQTVNDAMEEHIFDRVGLMGAARGLFGLAVCGGLILGAHALKDRVKMPVDIMPLVYAGLGETTARSVSYLTGQSGDLPEEAAVPAVAGWIPGMSGGMAGATRLSTAEVEAMGYGSLPAPEPLQRMQGFSTMRQIGVEPETHHHMTGYEPNRKAPMAGPPRIVSLNA